MLLVISSCCLLAMNIHEVLADEVPREVTGLREERAAVFPKATVLQFAVGLAVPAQIPNRTVFTNLGVLSNIPLPFKINQLYPYKGNSRQLTHNNLYRILESNFNWYNLDGRDCILKTICQVSNINFDNQNELIFEMLQLLFLPSKMKQPVAETHYMIAEQIGRNKSTNCSLKYPQCTLTILDMIAKRT